MSSYKSKKGPALAGLIVLSMALSGCAWVSDMVKGGNESKLTEPLVLFKDGLTSAPNVYFLGSPDNWAGDTLENVPTSGGKHGNITVVPGQIDKPNDGKRVTFLADSQVYLQSKTKQDLEAYLDADGAMVFDVIVHKPPQGEVTVRIDCTYPCMGPVDALPLFKSLPVGQKVTLKFPLACFAKAGAKFFIVNTPWLVHAASPFEATFGTVRWVPGAGKDPDVVKCPR
jgi:beta-glucosidase